MSIASFSRAAISDIQPDVIIVGAGPAGLVVASELLESGQTVVVLESGGTARDEKLDALNEVEVSGQPRAPQDTVRCRVLGGASALWTGRCGMLDPLDFDERPWLSHSGWPFGQDELRPYYHRSSRYLGIRPMVAPEDALSLFRQSFDTPPWNPAVFDPVLWQFSEARSDHGELIRQFAAASIADAEGVGVLQHSGAPKAVNLATHLRAPLEASKNVHVFTHANVSEIVVDAEGRVTAVEAQTMEGEALVARAPCIVLAAGGIENARLLLASRSRVENGLGNHKDQVGRYLTDHMFVQVGQYSGRAGTEIRRRMGSRWHPNGHFREVYALGLRPTNAIQRSERLLNASLHIVEFGKKSSAISALGSALRSLKANRDPASLMALAAAFARPLGLAEGAYDRFVAKRPPLNLPDETVIGCIVEQELNPESRITLSEQKNWLGQPLAKIDWRFSEIEYETSRFITEAFLGELDRLGIARPERPAWLDEGFDAWKAPLIDLAHPSCATRMSSNPDSGVVDENCKVHGVDGLYVIGSSVFATNGHMNPTNTIVALALRLSDHLKLKKKPAELRSVDNRPLRLGFVGAGHRVATVYQPVVKALGDDVEVVGAVAGSDQGAARIRSETGWDAFTDVSDFVSSKHPELIVVVIPPDAIDDQYPKYIGLDVPLLFETPFAWNEIAGRKLLKRINSKRMLVGVAEQFPFFPEAQLRQKLIESGQLGHITQVDNNKAIYDYHAMAVLRTHLGRGRRPKRAQGMISAHTKLLRGTIVLEDGGVISHDYSPAYFDQTFKADGQVLVIGDAGWIAGDRVIFERHGGAPLCSSISRTMDGDDLASLSVQTPDGEMLWENPYRGYHLSDEQIAVSEVLRGMVAAVRNAGVPPYRPEDALTDVELMATMQYSASRDSRFIAFPPASVHEKARRKAMSSLRKLASKTSVK
ncbi:GMC oxidoreductase [Roseibium album]|uniref:GMC oxidoreductase n=1 Tax=Roseibium album TaxID=311410 RepID=UPI00391BB4B7